MGKNDRISSVNEKGAEHGESMKLKVTVITSVWEFRNLFERTPSSYLAAATLRLLRLSFSWQWKKISVSWDVTPFNVVCGGQRFGQTCNNNSCLDFEA
jgi:hypothetical protein